MASANKMAPLQETLTLLREAAEKHDSVLVAYSGGKDSIVTLDLCAKTFKRVVCFFMYLVPGMQCIERELDRARERWGVQILQYPHWLVHKAISGGVYTNPWHELDDLEEWKLEHVYALAMAQSGVDLIATGAKRADSRWRKRMLATWGNKEFLLYPIVGWSKPDVLAYLRMNNLWVPDSSKGSATGIDFSTPSLLWLHDHYPEDFARLAIPFPYIWAAVYRRRFFGRT